MFRRFMNFWRHFSQPEVLALEVKRVVDAEFDARATQVTRESSDPFVSAVRQAIAESGKTGTAETLRVITECRDDLIRLQLVSRRLAAQAGWRQSPPPVAPAITPWTQDFRELLAQLRGLHPRHYETWERINFATTPEVFRQSPETSCSTGRRPADAAFSGFVAPYLRGRVLDIGCGPYALPVYLEEYPHELIYGIDPLDPFEPHPFTFAKGFAEFLPFPDGVFETVIAATSLDHTLSLARGLREIRRVLNKGGALLVWDGFVNGAPPYDPDDPALEPIDAYHLFHFDEQWFEQAMVKHGFRIEEKLAFDLSPHASQYCTSFFYCLRST